MSAHHEPELKPQTQSEQTKLDRYGLYTQLKSTKPVLFNQKVFTQATTIKRLFFFSFSTQKD